MTRQEALHELYTIFGYGFYNERVDEALNMAIKALEQEPSRATGKWIPCSERLPYPNKAVLAYIDNGINKTYCLAYWNNTMGDWEGWLGCDLLGIDKQYVVIAWMPLPEPYKVR